MSDRPIVPPVERRERRAWYLYDFGNSAYAAVVLLSLYQRYFTTTVAPGAAGLFLWSLAMGLATFAVAILSPLLGAFADAAGSKKRFLFLFTTISCVFTAALFFVTGDSIVAGMVFYILAEIGYRSAQVFYDALLPEIATESEMGRVSGNGWAIGSAGGILCIVLVIALMQLVEGEWGVRASFVLTGVFYGAFAIPIFLCLRERGKPEPLSGGRELLALPFRRIAETFRAIRHYKEFGKFVLAFLVYNDGIMMTLGFAAILGGGLFGLQDQQLLMFMILVQATSVLGAYVLGWITDRTNARTVLLGSLAMMLGAITWMYFNRSLAAFYVIGGVAGFALTGVQSVSRTMIGLLAPEGRSAEFYGFFSLAGRTSHFVGPIVCGFVASRVAVLLEKNGMDTSLAYQGGLRAAILSIAAFLLVGTAMLLFVDERAGRSARHAER
ncbi:MAG: MFS transporter [Candidatus Bipolaricaulia bacterium]